MKLLFVTAALVSSITLCNLSGRLGNGSNPNNNSNQTANGNVNVSQSPETNANDESNDTATVLRELLDVENEWTEANNRADRETLERILAEEFLGTDPNGRVENKQQYLASIQPNNIIRSWDFDDLNLARSGSNAVLTGILIIRGQEGNGRFTRRFRFTDSFVRRDGRWQAISSQVMEIAPPPPSRNRRGNGGGTSGAGNGNSI